MTIGTNIPGMYTYTQQKQKPKPAASGPFMPPTSPILPQPSGPTAPTPTVPQPGQGSPMGEYIERQSQTTMTPKPPAPAPWEPYRPTPTAPPAGVAPVAQPQAPQPVQAPQTPAPAPYTPPPAPAAPPLPQAGPTPQAGAAGSTLQDPGQITDAGKAYAARVTQNLQGNNPIVQNANQAEDTAAARRAYAARKGATESLAQTPYSPGSAQYQRVMTETQAGVDTANQAGRNQVNAVTRQATADSMAAASGLEDQQFGRAIGERTNSQFQAQQLGNSIQDPKAKYAFQRAVAAGVDPQEAYKAIVGETGTIAEPYRGQSPVQNVQQDATDWIKATQPNLDPASPEFRAAVTARMQEVDEAQRQPVTNSNKETAKEGIRESIRTGETMTPEQEKEAVKTGVIPSVAAGAVPRGDNVASWLKDNPGGKFAVNGEVYTLVRGDRSITGRSTYLNQPRYTDYAEVKDSKGNTKYFWDGKAQDKPPKHLGPVKITPFGF